MALEVNCSHCGALLSITGDKASGTVKVVTVKPPKDEDDPLTAIFGE